MLATVFIGYVAPAVYVFFYRRIDNHFFGYGVTSQLPDEEVPVSCPLIGALVVDDMRVVRLELAVVVAYRV